MNRAPLTAVVLTYNEQANIAACLHSLNWADDVVLVDSHSTDKTLDVARRSRPDIRIYSNGFEDFGQQRNWALDNTTPRYPWVLFFDADERSNDAFAAAVRSRIDSPTSDVGFFLCYRNYFLGTWIKRCTMFPSWQLRLLRLGHVRYRKEGHGQREVSQGPLGYIPEPYDHYGFSKGVEHWIARHNHYSTHETELIRRLQCEPVQLRAIMQRDPVARRRSLKRLAARVGFRPLMRFIYLYGLRGGFLDGRAGLIFCLLRAAQEIHITAKLAEAHHLPTVDPLSSELCGNPVSEPPPAEEPCVTVSSGSSFRG